MDTGQQKASLTGHTSSVYSVAFSPDGQTLASGSWDGTILLWDMSPYITSQPPPQPPTADFNGDGIVDFADFFEFVDAFGGTDPRFDLDGDGIVDFADFFEFVDAFGS